MVEKVKTFPGDAPQEPIAVNTALTAWPVPAPPFTSGPLRHASGLQSGSDSVLHASQVHALMQACCDPQGQPERLLRAWADAGTDWEDIYLQGVVGAAQLLGDLWVSDRLDFVAVSIASTRLQQTLYDLSPTFLSHAHEAHNGLSALLMCSPGSQHSMGVFMLGEFFRRAGWRVCGSPLMDAESAVRLVQSDWLDVLGLSLGSERCMVSAASLIRDVRRASANPALKIMVGGPMLALARDCMGKLGADFIGADARESLRLASQYVRQDPTSKLDHRYRDNIINTPGRMPALTLVERDAV